MKTLALLRHAKSSWDDPGLPDFERPLTSRGEKAARRMGRELKSRKLAFDLVLASPARRVAETIAGFEEGFGKLGEPRFDRAVYAADCPTLLDRVRRVDDPAESLLLIGHNPGLHDLATLLAAEDDPLRGAVDEFPTAALVLFELPAKRWAEVEPGTARIQFYLKPRDLD